jgi:rubrerythrin
MNEKDALRELLERKERAEEDLYFAKRDRYLTERDRELMAKLVHEQEAEHEHTIRELARFRCPQCGVQLHQGPFHGALLDVCSACKGVWLSKEKLEAVSLGKGQRCVKNFLAELARLMEHPSD